MPRKRDIVKVFCGRKCVGIYFHPYKIANCKMCNKEFKIRSGRKYFCSAKCYNKSQIIIHNRKCKRCKKQFILKNIAYEKRGAGKFCSVECGTRKFDLNENYFKNINTSDKAYWLGFLYADGCVYQNKKRSEFKINLACKDKLHLYKLKKALKSKHKIHQYKRKDHHKIVTFCIGSKKLIKNLILQGCVPNKTKILKFPNKLQNKFIRHFIRGFFDGDGCITVNKRGYKRVIIYCASDLFTKKLHLILKKNNIQNIIYKRKRDKFGLTLIINSKHNINQFGQFIYKRAKTFLNRKKVKF